MTTILTENSLIILLVTCAMDENRSRIENETIDNLQVQLINSGLCYELLIFDNGSRYRKNQINFKVPTTLIECKENFGYWSALNWTINEHLKDSYQKFIYIIESDIIHKTLKPLTEIISLMKTNEGINHVRTQKFSIWNRLRYDKRFHFLPKIVHDHANAVSYRHPVTMEKVFFKKIKNQRNLFYSNLHPKLPGLHRISILQKIFQDLSQLPNFNENHLFSLALSFNHQIVIHSPGIWKTVTDKFSKEILTGSYSSPEMLRAANYHATRTAIIQNISPDFIQIKYYSDEK